MRRAAFCRKRAQPAGQIAHLQHVGRRQVNPEAAHTSPLPSGAKRFYPAVQIQKIRKPHGGPDGCHGALLYEMPKLQGKTLVPRSRLRAAGGPLPPWPGRASSGRHRHRKGPVHLKLGPGCLPRGPAGAFTTMDGRKAASHLMKQRRGCRAEKAPPDAAQSPPAVHLNSALPRRGIFTGTGLRAARE